MNLINRAKAPTPKFFQKLRSIGMIVAAIGGAIVTAPVTLPVVISTIGGYIALAGGVISAMSQITTVNDSNSETDASE